MKVYVALAVYEECSAEWLDSPAQVRAALEAAVVAGKFTHLQTVVHHFEPQGVTACAVVGESHLALHSWPEERRLFVTVASCSTRESVRLALEAIGASLPGGARVSVDEHEIVRDGAGSGPASVAAELAAGAHAQRPSPGARSPGPAQQRTPAQQRPNMFPTDAMWSAERNLLSWVRTGIALTAFGFVVGKLDLIQRGAQTSAGAALAGALVSLAGGAVSVVAAVGYHRSYRELEAGRRPRASVLGPVLMACGAASIAVLVTAALWLLAASRAAP